MRFWSGRWWLASSLQAGEHAQPSQATKFSLASAEGLAAGCHQSERSLAAGDRLCKVVGGKHVKACDPNTTPIAYASVIPTSRAAAAAKADTFTCARGQYPLLLRRLLLLRLLCLLCCSFEPVFVPYLILPSSVDWRRNLSITVLFGKKRLPLSTNRSTSRTRDTLRPTTSRNQHGEGHQFDSSCLLIERFYARAYIDLTIRIPRQQASIHEIYPFLNRNDIHRPPNHPPQAPQTIRNPNSPATALSPPVRTISRRHSLAHSLHPKPHLLDPAGHLLADRLPNRPR